MCVCCSSEIIAARSRVMTYYYKFGPPKCISPASEILSTIITGYTLFIILLKNIFFENEKYVIYLIFFFFFVDHKETSRSDLEFHITGDFSQNFGRAFRSIENNSFSVSFSFTFYISCIVVPRYFVSLKIIRFFRIIGTNIIHA